jgi:hypothetical protein
MNIKTRFILALTDRLLYANIDWLHLEKFVRGLVNKVLDDIGAQITALPSPTASRSRQGGIRENERMPDGRSEKEVCR